MTPLATPTDMPAPASPARWWIAFSLLILAVHEAHELAHVLTGRILCGTWAERDFNTWRIVDCASVLPTAAGPIFSYLLLFAGAAIASAARPGARWVGVALLFAGNPFARIFTAAMGGGDEMIVGRRLAGVANRTPAVHVLVLAVVAAICGTAIVLGWRRLCGLKRRALWFVAMLLWPMVLTGILLFVVGNGLLRAGVLAAPIIVGAPLLVIVVTIVVFLLAALTNRWLSGVELGTGS